MKKNKSLYGLLIILIFLNISCSSIDNTKGTDFHVHVGKPPKVKVDDVSWDAKRSLLAIKSINLSRALIISRGYQKNRNQKAVISENNYVIEMQKNMPLVFSAACGVSITHIWAIEETERCIKIGAKVFKLHFMADGVDLQNENILGKVNKVLSLISNAKLSILVHAAYPKSKEKQSIELVKLINKYPDITWIIGHLFGRNFKMISEIKHSNYYVETSILPLWMKKDADKKSLVSSMREIGIEHFVFGSDWPVIHPAESLKSLRELGLSKSEINKILYINATFLDKIFEN